jgi:PAS domain S-box-containing protein
VLDAVTQVSIIATDAGGLITVFNRGAEQMLGYGSDEMDWQAVAGDHSFGFPK